jgi:hypothetical protein
MKLSDAMSIIRHGGMKPPGFRVHFEHKNGNILTSDYFPESDEAPFSSEESAWWYAEQFAQKTKGKCINIYVVDGSFVPVRYYELKMIENR